MKHHFYTLLCVLGFLGTDLYGQYYKNPNALIVKKTFIDHFTPITGQLPQFEELSGGWEIGYSRHLSGPLNLYLPVKLGVVKLPESNENLTTVGLDGVVQVQFFKPKNILNPYLVGGIAWVVEDFKLNQNYFQTPAGVGVNIKLSPAAFLNIQTEYRYTINKKNRNNIQYGMGLVFFLDKVQEEKDPFEQLKLAKQQDSDGDGLKDAIDKCPFTKGPMIFNGCPDSDGDGIADPADDCPSEPGIAAAKGCPDKDHDGFSDLVDQCPDIAGKVFGCPDENQDGFIDGTTETVPTSDEFVTKGGLELTYADLEILDMALKNVQFEVEKAKLKINSLIYLERVAEVLLKYPNYKLRISGYTDSTGDKTFNKKLSMKRAKACYDYFVSYGISKERLEYNGYGEAFPIADNRSEEGRTMNRRVEFKLFY